MTESEQPRPTASLPLDTPIVYLEGKRQRAGTVYAVGRYHYHLLLEDGSEICTYNLDAVIERKPEPSEAAPAEDAE